MDLVNRNEFSVTEIFCCLQALSRRHFLRQVAQWEQQPFSIVVKEHTYIKALTIPKDPGKKWRNTDTSRNPSFHLVILCLHITAWSTRLSLPGTLQNSSWPSWHKLANIQLPLGRKRLPSEPGKCITKTWLKHGQSCATSFHGIPEVWSPLRISILVAKTLPPQHHGTHHTP